MLISTRRRPVAIILAAAVIAATLLAGISSLAPEDRGARTWNTVPSKQDRAFQALLPDLRPALRQDYERWLSDSGLQTTSDDPSPFPGDDRWFVAVDDFRLEAPLFGERAIRVIVPANVWWLDENGLGDSTFYVSGGILGEPHLPRYADMDAGSPP